MSARRPYYTDAQMRWGCGVVGLVILLSLMWPIVQPDLPYARVVLRNRSDVRLDVYDAAPRTPQWKCQVAPHSFSRFSLGYWRNGYYRLQLRDPAGNLLAVRVARRDEINRFGRSNIWEVQYGD